MKLQLNVPMLERLIGGDTEIELEIRNHIAEEFAKKHLKELAKEEVHQKAVKEIKDYVDKIAKENFDIINMQDNVNWIEAGRRLKSKIEALVNEIAQKAVNDTVLKIIENQNIYWRREINNAVDKALNKEIDKLILEGIKKRLEVAAHAN